MFFILVFGSIFFLNILAVLYAAASLSGVHFRTLGGTVATAFAASTICYISIPMLQMLGVPLLILMAGLFQFSLILTAIHYLNLTTRGVQFDSGPAITVTAMLLTGLNWMFSIVCNLGIWLPW